MPQLKERYRFNITGFAWVLLVSPDRARWSACSWDHWYSVLVWSSEKFEGMSWESSIGEELKVTGGVEVTGSVDSKALSHCGEGRCATN